MPHAGSLHAATEPGERPTVSRLARWQAANGLDMVSLAYMRVLMEEPAARLLITLLDGTRDRQAILAGAQGAGGPGAATRGPGAQLGRAGAFVPA